MSSLDDGRLLVLLAVAGLGGASLALGRAGGSKADVVSDREKRDIVEMARQIVSAKYGSCPVSGACMWHALAVIEAARSRGRHLVLQAGSAFWERMTNAQDDGVSPTHFGYEFDAEAPLTKQIVARIKAGRSYILPEMHVWAGGPQTHEIVDVSTRYFPEQCMSLIGQDWPGKRPPDFLWASAGDFPDEAIYRPSREATLLAMALAAHELRR